MREVQLLGRLLLEFKSDTGTLREDLSAAVRGPAGHLWVAGDEEGFVERLSMTGPRTFADHVRFSLPDLLPHDEAGPEQEIDLEAVDHADGYLWVVGSHSAKRKKPKGKDERQDLERLSTVVSEPTRFLLGRVPLQNGTPERLAGPLRAARLREAEGGGSLLVELLRQDSHLGPFMALPSKDNGLDIEGVAIVGDRVLLGLRGPVLRGYAVVIELTLGLAGSGLLEPQPLTNGALYRKHFLALDGLGIRELCLRGDDLLILAGPTMDLAAPLRLFILPGGIAREEDSVQRQEKGGLQPLFDVSRDGQEKAEGAALFSWFEENDSLLVVYDTPAPQRLHHENGVLADVFRLEVR